MAWPPPTSAGADPFDQYIAGQQQYQQLTSNMNNPSSATPYGHDPITSEEIAGEYEFNTSHHPGPQGTYLIPREPGLDGSSSGPSGHSPAHVVARPYAQSPQGHQQQAGGSGGRGDGRGSGVAPSKSMLETRKSLQARGKNYHFGSGGPQGREWEERQRRDEAVSILESEEMIMWIAGVRNESIPQTRAHYRNIVLGLTQWEKDDVAWRDEWEVQGTGGGSAEGQSMTGGSPARSAKGKERDIAKMRKRVSSGQGHG